ncbi:MAG: hypothetical protein TR69_WS6001000791 [candidate division WS6 bacterium OLB20]|uniref:Uncharacterized protein n=1 Tax=candidate division WS6 bacterium OLB20 TaxID=1617426 RepID=A0A136LYM2_9BACT|nr:MAG: hypothetical protein TR69_WS6001000791 [candidate division WS6 bacterium OLB20]
MNARLEGMLSGKSADELRTEQVELLNAKKELEHSELTDDVKHARLSSDEYLRKRRELDMLKLERKREEQKTTASQVRQEDAPVDREMIVSLEEQLAAAQQRLAYHKRREQVVGLVLQELAKAVKATASSAQKVVSAAIEQHLGTITGGRYTEARLRDDLAVEVFSAEKNDWVVPTEALSAGTVDQIYFLARLAFLKTIAGNNPVPLLLDDPFVTCDAPRRLQIRAILEKYKDEYQILFFTHYPEYEDWGDNVIAL